MACPADPASVCLTQWLCHVGGRHARGRCVASAQAGEVEGKKAGGRASCMPNAGARVGVQAAERAGGARAGEVEGSVDALREKVSCRVIKLQYMTG